VPASSGRTTTKGIYRTDYVLTQDKSFKKIAKSYAEDQDLFFKDFAAACGKLFELGVPSPNFVTSEAWSLKTMDEQKSS
jgi:cytochrome c peroxidase